MEEKERYLTLSDLKNIIGIMEEIQEYLFRGEEEEAYNDVEEVFINWGAVLELDPENCNVFLKYKL
jgi:hypothetical protein